MNATTHDEMAAAHAADTQRQRVYRERRQELLTFIAEPPLHTRGKTLRLAGELANELWEEEQRIVRAWN